MKWLFLVLLLTGCSYQTHDTHKEGDKEYFWKFAFIPINCTNNETVWLKSVRVERRYEELCSYVICNIVPFDYCIEVSP